MEKEPYTKREHDLIFTDIRTSMQEIKEELTSIKENMEKTNTKVSNLELWRAGWDGKMVVIGLISGAIITGIITWIAKRT